MRRMTDQHDAPADQAGGAGTRPLTGDEYIESLRDDREVFLYGDRVKDVTTHPAFANPVRMTARLYDALHDPAHRDALTTRTDSGGTGYTHRFFTTPRSAEDLVADQRAIATWSRMSYGWMGRSPDYKAAFLGTLGANADFYAPFSDNARRWYRESQEKVLYWNHAIVHPPVDRSLPPTASPTCSCTWRRKPTPVWWSAGPRWSPPARRSPTRTSSPTTDCR